MKLKKKHHYVSQFYLREWANKKGEILAFDGVKTYTPSIDTSIGFKKHLYRGIQFTKKQRSLIEEYCIRVGYEKLSTYYLSILSIFATQQLFDDSDLLVAQLDKNLKFEKLENLKKEFQSNLLEDSFSESESKFKITLAKIINNKIDTLNLNDYDILVHFIAFQLVRTPKKLNKIKTMTTDKIIHHFRFSPEQLDFFNLLMALCMSEQLYLSALSRLDLITIYYNNTPKNFITSDDPSFNQKILEKELFIQIPITPKIMIEISRNYESKEATLSFLNYLNSYKSEANSIIMLNKTIFIKNIDITEDVDQVNKIIFKNRDNAVYGISHDDFINLS